MVDGFCFEARQKRILIGDTHGFVDMVFYHRILKCHVLIELKLQEFSHQNIGQLNTYVSWYAKNMMVVGDNPPIGILLCTQKDQALAEYALAGMDNKLFVSKYQLHLPAREQLQRELERTLETEIINTLIKPVRSPAFLGSSRKAPVACDNLPKSPVGFLRRSGPCDLATLTGSTPHLIHGRIFQMPKTE